MPAVQKTAGARLPFSPPPVHARPGDSVELHGLHSSASDDDTAHVSTLRRIFAAAGLVTLSLTGFMGAASTARAAENVAAQTSISTPTTTTRTTPAGPATTTAPEGFIIAGPNLVGAPAPTAPAQQAPTAEPPAAPAQVAAPALPAPATLPQPNARSRRAVDRVEINARFDRIATEVGVDPELVKAIAWQESTWLHHRQGGLTTQANVDEATGEVRSIDSGIMQINDKAHPKAFPAAATLDGNIRYGSRYARQILAESGADGIWRYNGDPLYGPLIQRHLRVKPWTAGVLRDHARALTQEKASLERSVPKAEKSIPGLRATVEANRRSLSIWEQRVQEAQPAPDATPTKQQKTKLESAEQNVRWARRTLERSEKKLADAESSLLADQGRLAVITAEIAAVREAVKQEVDRIKQANAREDAAMRDRLLKEVEAHVERLGGQRQSLLSLSSRLEKLKEKPVALDEAIRHLRGSNNESETDWKSIRGRLRGNKPINLNKLEKDLRDARRRLDKEVARREDVSRQLQAARRTG